MKQTMKIWVVTLVGMASVFVPSALWGQNQRLTGQLQQLFDCAEQNNASLTRMRAAIATAEAGEETARLAQLPDVEAQLSISYLGDVRLWNRTFGESMAAPMPHFGNPLMAACGHGGVAQLSPSAAVAPLARDAEGGCGKGCKRTVEPAEEKKWGLTSLRGSPHD